MIKSILLLAMFALFRFPQDVRVITYSNGAADSAAYESLSFWIKSDHRAYIRYRHGRDADDVEFTWVGPTARNGRKGFLVQLPQPDTANMVVIPQGDSLEVSDRTGRYPKIIRWENENGAAGDSTCSICAQDAQQAMSWLRKYFLQ